MTAARKPRDVFVFAERFENTVNLIARIGELVQLRSQFAVVLEGETWVLSYPETKEMRDAHPF